MCKGKKIFGKKWIAGVLMFLAAGMLTACAGEPEKIKVEPVKVESYEEEGKKDASSGAEDGEGAAEGPESMEDNAEADTGAGEISDGAETSVSEEKLKEWFGENCIVEQTFEVELSEYEGKVYFVPYRPKEDGAEFYMQIVRDGEIMTEINSYVPEALQQERFGSLDAVSFFDLNFDGNTDIVLIETYGDTTFAAVYYGEPGNKEEGNGFFLAQSQLSEALTDALDTVSVSELRTLLTGGKKNGGFSDYQEAYGAVIRLCELEESYNAEEYSQELTYDLIDFDGDDIPELVAGVPGYYVSLYTYTGGRVCTLMDKWGYGAMGNAGYEYAPGKNSLRNQNADYAGAILYTTYMTMGAEHTMEQVVQIVFYNFDDVNGNGIPDEEEQSSIGYYGVTYIDGREVTAKECEAYDMGGYEFIAGEMSAEDMLAQLGQ